MNDALTLTGPIYEFKLDGGIACLRVWRDPAVDGATGARCAVEMLEHLSEHVYVPMAGYRGVLMDVRKGPPAFGPKTQVSLVRIIQGARQAGLHFAALVGDSAMQNMQFHRLCSEHGPAIARVFTDEEAALDYAKNG